MAQVGQNLMSLPYAIKFSAYFIFQAIAVYFNLYFLIPRYLEKKKYLLYLVFLSLTIIVTASIIVSGYYIGAQFSTQSIKELYSVGSADFFSLFKYNSLDSTIAAMALAMSIKLTKSWIESKRRQDMLEKEKLETELKFLKSQFNPHFLFNTINSIFVLIHKNPDMASESLAKFSNLLRYQLYECNEHQIPLQREISYLENFLELEKLRQESHLEVKCQIEGETDAPLTIAPFILMPFLENAFKHVSQSKKRQNWIRLSLKIQEEHLFFAISNSSKPASFNSQEVVDYGGIGLKNVQRRLELLYPGRHELTIQASDKQFDIHLQLHLKAALGKTDPPAANVGKSIESTSYQYSS
ncbi:MAG: histidine kinase [Saprospiraceae bacterium]|nr:histidine kinase [Saprospiraceae bacterium]